MPAKKNRKAVPIEWCFPNNFISRYATNLAIQHSEHEFILSFFEAKPPLLIGTPEELKKQVLNIKSIKAECVARIIISAERMPTFVKVLQDNLAQFQKLTKKE
jgi:hypothetical protein